MCNRNHNCITPYHNCIGISIFVPVRIDIFATGKHVNHGGEYGLEISTIFHFHGPKKVIKLAQKIIKTEENLNKIVKHCPK